MSLSASTLSLKKRLICFTATYRSSMNGLPYNSGTLDAVPTNASARRAWLSERLLNRFRATAEKYRDLLIALYGGEVGTHIEYAEAFEGCEYGASLTAENIPTLFPFFPIRSFVLNTCQQNKPVPRRLCILSALLVSSLRLLWLSSSSTLRLRVLILRCIALQTKMPSV